jgi:UDP-galactopyranose mutase
MVMSRDQIAGQNHNITTDNISFDRVEEFKYLGTTLANQNSIQEEVKSRFNSGNACYYLVQNLLFSSLLSKNLKNI